MTCSFLVIAATEMSERVVREVDTQAQEDTQEDGIDLHPQEDEELDYVDTVSSEGVGEVTATDSSEDDSSTEKEDLRVTLNRARRKRQLRGGSAKKRSRWSSLGSTSSLELPGAALSTPVMPGFPTDKLWN